MLDISINRQQRIYVIGMRDGVACFGFDNARDHARRIASCLRRPDLEPVPTEEGTPAGYLKYLAAVQAWRDSSHGGSTYFGPGTSDELATVLERCRHDRCKVRLILGDTETGKQEFDWLELIGRVGRSCGALKVPLLLEPGRHCGSPIACARVLAVLDWETGLPLYRHASYRQPDLRLQFIEDPQWPWNVMHRDHTVAKFSDIAKAGAYIAFMRGASVEPRVFR